MFPLMQRNCRRSSPRRQRNGLMAKSSVYAMNSDPQGVLRLNGAVEMNKNRFVLLLLGRVSGTRDRAGCFAPPSVIAISLLALLLTEGSQAYATPSTDAGAPLTSAPTLPEYLAPSSYGSINVQPYALTGRTTFSTQAGGGPGAPTSPFETISTINRTIAYDHAKPGKMSATSTGVSNGGGISVYIGRPSSSDLAPRDGTSGGSTTSRYTLNAVYIPHGPPPSSASTTSISGTVRASGPIDARSILGSEIPSTPQSTVPTAELEIPNPAPDISGVSSLAIKGYAISGVDAGSFSVAPTVNGGVIQAGGTLLIPLVVVGTGPGDLTSDLTIFTNQGSSGRAGEHFNDLLDPMVVTSRASALPAPEPASIALLGVGLAALAGARLRHAGMPPPLPRNARS